MTGITRWKLLGHAKRFFRISEAERLGLRQVHVVVGQHRVGSEFDRPTVRRDRLGVLPELVVDIPDVVFIVDFVLNDGAFPAACP